MRNIAIFFIKIYRNYLSMLKLQQSCIYYPSCSEYAISALEKHGFLKGSFISILRILRCHPFSHGGYDPVIGCHNINTDYTDFKKDYTDRAMMF